MCSVCTAMFFTRHLRARLVVRENERIPTFPRVRSPRANLALGSPTGPFGSPRGRSNPSHSTRFPRERFPLVGRSGTKSSNRSLATDRDGARWHGEVTALSATPSSDDLERAGPPGSCTFVLLPSPELSFSSPRDQISSTWSFFPSGNDDSPAVVSVPVILGRR